jgi:hypothetical protein
MCYLFNSFILLFNAFCVLILSFSSFITNITSLFIFWFCTEDEELPLGFWTGFVDLLFVPAAPDEFLPSFSLSCVVSFQCLPLETKLKKNSAYHRVSHDEIKTGNTPTCVYNLSIQNLFWTKYFSERKIINTLTTSKKYFDTINIRNNMSYWRFIYSTVRNCKTINARTCI